MVIPEWIGMSKKENKQEEKAKNQLKDVAKYSAIAFQMLAIVLAGVFGGIKLDQIVSLDFPLFTVILSLLAVALAIYYSIRDLIKF